MPLEFELCQDENLKISPKNIIKKGIEVKANTAENFNEHADKIRKNLK